MHRTTSVRARVLSLGAVLVLALACNDREPTGMAPGQPRFQVTSAPVVNSLADPGDGVCNDVGTGDGCTLREAITFASGGATITFASGLTGTITLGSTLNITKSLTISGPGANQLAVSGNDAVEVFWFTAGASTISGLAITHGKGSGGGGGGMYLSNAVVITLRDCALTNNGAGPFTYQNGGAIFVSGTATLIVNSCTLSGNDAGSSGTAIYSVSGTSVTILNSTISGNGYGTTKDAIMLYGTGSIDHSTITANGGGVYSTVTGLTVKGSIIWGNSYADVNASVDNAYTSLGYNLLGTDGNGWVDFGHDFKAAGDQTGVADAKLGSLALNSPGTTQTHALQEGSPAIDAGVCTDVAGGTLGTDQRGVTRPQGTACDIGSYEKESSGGLITPTFSFDLSTLPAKTVGDASFSVAGYVTTNSTGTKSFEVGMGSVGCNVTTAGEVTIGSASVDPSHCIIKASVAANATYAAAGPISQSFNIAKAAGSVSISNLPASGEVGGSFTPTYTKLGDGTASTTSTSPTICSVSAGVVHYDAIGTCTLHASVTEGTDYLAATGADQTFAITGLITPTFSFDLSTLPAKTVGDAPFSVVSYVTTNSTGTKSFQVGMGSVGCDVTTAGIVTIGSASVDPSHCIIKASVAADATYAAAGPISQSFNIAKAAGSVSISNLPASGEVGGSFTPTYTKLGDGTASTTSTSPTICSVLSGVVHYDAQGTCTLHASVTEGTDYQAATGSDQSFTIGLITPTLGFNLSTLPAKTFGDAPFSVAGYVTTNSTGTKSFALGTGSVGCTVNATTGEVTITGAAVDPSHCIIEASVAASATYAAAGPVSQSINIAKAAGSVTISNLPASGNVGGSFTPTYTKLGNGTTSVSSTTPTICSVSAGVVHYDAEGTCTLVSSVTEGTNHLAATGTPQNITVGPTLTFSSSCSYTINARNDARVVTVTWANASPGVTLIQVNDGKTVSKVLNPTVSGSWRVNVKTGLPTYGLSGGTTRRDATTVLVAAGTACRQTEM